jgi:hypothetical protein
MVDPEALKEAVDEHEKRFKTVWNNDEGRNEDPMAWARKALPQRVEAMTLELSADGMAELAMQMQEEPDSPTRNPEIVSRLDAIERAIVALTEAGRRGPSAVPEWLRAAAGDPETYDQPDAGRISVKVRVLPRLVERLELARARFGLQSLTGTWECLLRLGLAAAERLPVRD